MNIDETESLNRKKRALPVRDETYSEMPSVEYGDEEERREKPWQRVLHEVTRKGTHLYEPVRSVPGALLLALLGGYLLAGYLLQLLEDDMPRALTEAELPEDSWEAFSEEAARRYLERLLGGAPRAAGTRAHLAQTVELKRTLDDIARRAALPVHTDWQLVSGDYWLEFKPPHVNCYQNLSNVVALLEGEAGFHPNGTIGTSLLVNCHYDSVPFAIGASDNGAFCAIMLETLSRLSRRATKFKHNIVFLFNGAEENPLQGSHGFLAHPWARGLVSVVNLDAAGMNGKANVFQVTDPRLLSAYAQHVSRPSAQSVGEFLFSSGIIPSDTDFRIWRDFGGIHGMDIAFVKWAAVYHTRYDAPALLRRGVLQCAGDALRALLPALAERADLAERREPQAAVYFDYLNWFVVHYALGAAAAVDAAGALLALLSVGYYVWLVGCRVSTLAELLLAAAGRLAAAAAGLAVVAIFTAIMVATTVQLRYLSEQWLVVPLYWLPYLIGAVSVAHGFDAWRSKKSGLNRSIRALQAMAATRLLLALALLAACGVRALATVRYVVTVPLVLTSLSALVSLTLVRYVRLRGWQHLLLEAALTLPAALFPLALALRLDAALLPTLGRSVAAAPDYTAALVNAGLAVLAASAVSGIELLFSRRRLWIPVACVSVLCIIVMFLPLHPYRDEGPATQRHYWFHTEVVSHDALGRVTERTTGVLVTPHDAYTVASAEAALRDAGLRYNTRRDFRRDCDTRVFCDLPLYRLRFAPYLADSLFIYMPGPEPLQPPPSVRVTSRACTGELCTLHLVMHGPAHNTLTIWPHANVSLASWSFASPARPTLVQLGRPVYVIIESTPTYSEHFEPLNFTLTFVAPPDRQQAPLAALSQHAHLTAHPERFSAAYRALLAAAPPFFNVASFISVRHNYEL